MASALRAAGAGPVSMIVGSAPETAVARIRARGVEPELGADLLGADRDQRGAVDDARGVAGVVDVVDLLDPVVLLQRHVVEAAPASPMLRRSDGLSPARLSTVVSGRMNSSWSRTVTPLRSLTGTTARSK